MYRDREIDREIDRDGYMRRGIEADWQRQRAKGRELETERIWRYRDKLMQ